MSGCDSANWMPDCSVGSTLVIGLLVVVRAVSHERLHAPPPHGSRWRMPVDENQSCTSTPASPNRELVGGVTLRDRPSVVEKIGAYAPRLSPTRAASASVSSRTMARSGLCSMARWTASSSVRETLSGREAVWALADVAIMAT